MSTKISSLAGKPAPIDRLVNVSKLPAAYYDQRPDPSVPAQRVAFGTSGHRGSSFDATFNEAHVLGASAPADLLLREYGFSVEEVCRRAQALLGQAGGGVQA